MEKEPKTKDLSVTVANLGKEQKGGEPLLALSSLKITNEKNPSPVPSAHKSGCGKCG